MKNIINRFYRPGLGCVTGLFIGLLYWIIDTAILSFVLHEGPYIHQLFFPDADVIWMRAPAIVIILISGFFIDIYFYQNKVNQEGLLDLMEHAPDGLLIIDSSGAIRFINQRLEQMSGYTRDEVIGEQVEIFIPERYRELRDIGQDYISSPYAHKISVEEEFYLVDKDGNEFPVEIILGPMLLEQEKVISAMIRDISEQKQIIEALISSEARSRRYFEANMIGMAIMSPDMTINQFNDKYCEITGYTRDELLNMHWTDYTHPDDLDIGVEDFNRAKNGEMDSYSFNKRYIHKDGHIVELLISARFVYLESGAVDYAVCFIQDITEQKRVEKELREREKYLREAQRIAKLGFWEWDYVTNRVFWSSELYSMLDVEPDKFVITSDSIQNLIHPDDRARFNEHFSSVLDIDTPLFHEHRVLLLNGEVRYHRVQGEVIRDSNGTPVRMIGTILDITEQKQTEQTLRLYEHIVNASTNAMAIVDTEYKYLAVNQHYLKAFNKERDEVVGRYVEDIVGGDNFSNIAKPNIDKALTGVSSNIQGWSYQPGFGKRYLDIVDTPYIDENGKVAGVVISAHDLTDRKLAEEELERNEEMLRRYYEAGTVGMGLSSPEMGMFQFNDTYAEIIGYPRKDLVHMTWQEITHPDDIERNGREYERVINGEIDRFTIDKRILRKNGEEVYITSVVNCARKQDGTVDYYVTFVQDITERKRAEEALKNSELRFTKAFNTTPDSVSITRLEDGRIVFINDGFTSLYGYTNEECIGKTTQELGLWKDLKDREELMELIYENNDVKAYEAEVVNKLGDVIPILLSATVIEVDGDDCIVVWQQDLRVAKQAEAERRKLEQQLFRSQKMEAVGQLTGGIAHDFNNILASILGYSNLALRYSSQLSETKLVDYIKEVIHGGERAKELINQMMMYSRSVPSEAASQPVQPLVEKTIKLLRPMIPSNIEILSQLPDDITDIVIDAAQFEQIIMNLCINARDAIEGSGIIELELYKTRLNKQDCASCHGILTGEYVVLSVSDTGTGIDKDIINYIFDPFYTTKEVGRGTGMGLSMIHGIMHNNDGHIMLDSIPGKGATFRLLFPVTKTEWNKPLQLNNKSQDDYRDEHKHGVIMIIDDEQAIVGYLGDLLESQGYEVIAMIDSDSALLKFKGDPGKIDLIITDQTMPGITGLELAKEILLLRSDIPIILSTGYSEKVNDEVAEQAGIRFYFTKPVNETMLLKKIDELLNSKQGPVTRKKAGGM